MGYYIHYSLDWKMITGDKFIPSCEHDKPSDAKYCPVCGEPIAMVSISGKISEFLKDNKDKFYGITPNGKFRDEATWYDHEQDIKELSIKFPSILFTLSGEGEEAGDIWKKYFINGKMQIANAEIVIPDFDMEKLK